MTASATDALLSRIRTVLDVDLRITAAWLSGSRGRGTADDLSDVDIWLAVKDHAIGKIVSDPLAFVHEIVPTIMHIQAPSIAPPGGVFLLTWIPAGEGFEQVDWYCTPASIASRPARTRLLFERHPLPVQEPAPDLLDDTAFIAYIDGTIRDALLMIANAWKHARRGDDWRTVEHVQHVGNALSRLDRLITHGAVPTFEDTVSSFLPVAVPIGVDDQREALRHLLDDLSSQVDRAGRTRNFNDAITAMSATLFT